jgi:nitroreductase
MIEQLVAEARTVRRFVEADGVTDETLRGLVDVARKTPNAANLQPLAYRLVTDAGEKEAVFPALAWAGYLKEWPGPPPGERPGGYIVVTRDRERKVIDKLLYCDAGIAAGTIQLRAREVGLGCCIIASFQDDVLSQALGLSDRYEVLLVLALGVPVEKAVIEPLGADESIRYYRDSSGTHHVPKRSLDAVVIDA